MYDDVSLATDAEESAQNDRELNRRETRSILEPFRNGLLEYLCGLEDAGQVEKIEIHLNDGFGDHPPAFLFRFRLPRTGEKSERISIHLERGA
jgi:hypothetical protein